MKLSELKNDWHYKVRQLLKSDDVIMTIDQIQKEIGNISSETIRHFVKTHYDNAKMDGDTIYGSPKAIVAAKKILGVK